MIHGLLYVFLSLYFSIGLCQYPYVCEEPSIIIETPFSLYEFVNCTPTINMYRKDEGRIIKQPFNWEFLHPIEISPNGTEIPLDIPTPDLPSHNSTVYTFWAHTIEPYYYQGRVIGSQISFTTPTTYIVSYPIVNETFIYSVDGDDFTVDAGGMKVELYIQNWGFRDPNNLLELPLAITTPKGMKGCSLSVHNSLQDHFYCKGELIDFVEFAQNFGVVNGSRVDMNYRIEHYFYPGYSVDDMILDDDNDDCNDDDDEFILPLSKVIFVGTIPAFDERFFYDPDVTLLLAGNNNNGNCKVETVDIVIAWLSLGLICVAIIIICIVLACGFHFPPLVKILGGKEHFRIEHVRNRRKKYFSKGDRLSSMDPVEL